MNIGEVLNPSIEDRNTALESYNALDETIKSMEKQSTAKIGIEGNDNTINVPFPALLMLRSILEAMKEGLPFSIVPLAAELTTQSAADILGCSRPFLVKLLEEGKIPFTKVGKHRRILMKDILDYKNEMKESRKQALIKLMKMDEEASL